MIELKITAGDADELFAHLQGLAGKNAPKLSTAIDFAAAKVQEAKAVMAEAVRNNLVAVPITPAYEPDADDEAEVDAEMVQGEVAVDSAGEAWDEAIHSPNKTTTKDGRWRLKKGAVRPEPALTSSEPGTSLPADETPEATEATDEPEDEFAAFTAAAAEPAAEPEVPAMTWTDADLSKLCNQAAQKLGNPAPIKDTIAKFVPEGEVPHSRNVPVEGRAEFAAAIEKIAGIEFVG